MVKKTKQKKESITDIYLEYTRKYQQIYGKKCGVLLEFYGNAGPYRWSLTILMFGRYYEYTSN